MIGYEIKQEISKKKNVISAMKEAGADDIAIEIVKEELRLLRRQLSILQKGNISGEKSRKTNVGEGSFNRKRMENYTGNEYVDMIAAKEEELVDDEEAELKALEKTVTEKEAMYVMAYKELGTLRQVAARYGVNESTVCRSIKKAGMKLEKKRKLEQLRKIIDGETIDMEEGLHRKYIAELLTGNQMLYFYLYYGEKISLRDIANARKVNVSTVSRMLEAANSKLEKIGDVDFRNVKALGDYVLKKYAGIDAGKEHRAYSAGYGGPLKRNIKVDGFLGKRNEACRIPHWMEKVDMEKMMHAFEEFKVIEGRGTVI